MHKRRHHDEDCKNDNCNSCDTKSIPATGHDWGEWEVKTPATGDQPGVKVRKCKVCGVTEEDEISEHKYGEWTVVKAATCTEKGTEQRTCADCGNVQTRSIPATGHEYEEETFKHATCTEDGFVKYKCKKCGDTYTEVLPATGHDLWGWSVVKEPTCTEPGLEENECHNWNPDGTRCDYKETREISATGHKYESKSTTVTVETAENGDKITKTTTEKICSSCGEAEHKEHVWSDWTVTKEPTTTEMGSKTRTCSECGATETMDIARVAEPEHKEHTWDDGVVTTPATCEKEGVKTYTCKTCGETKTEVIPATGHRFGDYEVTKEATCTEDGVKTAKCTHDGCTETKTESIPKTGHAYEDQTEQKKVVDKTAYDEEVEYTVWWCGCGEEFDSVDALTEHQEASDENHPGNSGTRRKTKIVHHNEEFHYETITKHVCKKCGHVKED